MTTGSMGSTNGGDARPRVLVAEDDRSVRESLVLALGLEGYDVDAVGDGEQALEAVLAQEPDAVLLDVMMPYLDGLTVCRRLRARGSKVPILMLTARHEVSDRVSGLDAGADDYLVKPFSAEQLDARIRAVLRRSATAEPTVLEVGGLTVDVRTRTAVLDGRELELRPREFDLLAYLAARPGEVVTKRTLLVDVWQSPYGGADKTVDVHLSWLRRKLGETAAEPRMLHSVRGVGVKLVAAP